MRSRIVSTETPTTQTCNYSFGTYVGPEVKNDQYSDATQRNPGFTQALMGGIHPLALALYRELGACTFMHAVAYKIDGMPAWRRLDLTWWSSDVKVFLLMGFLSFGNIVGFIFALNYITAFNGSLLHPSIPVFAAMIG